MCRSTSSAGAADSNAGQCLCRGTGGFGLPFFCFSCPAKAGKGDRALARWKGRGPQRQFGDENKASSQTPPPPCFAWSPSPAFAGADKRPPSRGTIAREFCRSTMSNSPRFRSSLRGAKRRSNPERHGKELDCFACARNDERKEKQRKRNAGRRSVSCPARKRRAGRATKRPACADPPLAGALACRRSTTALARGTLVPKAQLQARLPGTRPERSVLKARPNRGAETLRRLCGCYPPRKTCPSPGMHLPPRS